MKRSPTPDTETLTALRFIREFCLDQHQIAYRFTVDQIDTMCAEIGLPPIDGEKEADKVLRLMQALHVNDCYNQLKTGVNCC